MATLKALSPATRTSTDFGAFGTDVDAVMALVLQTLELHCLTLIATGTIPTLKSQDAIMDFIEADENLLNEFKSYNIPIEKFRWKIAVKDNKLTIKGITTVLCILKPIINLYGDLQHVEPEIDNLRLFIVE